VEAKGVPDLLGIVSQLVRFGLGGGKLYGFDTGGARVRTVEPGICLYLVSNSYALKRILVIAGLLIIVAILLEGFHLRMAKFNNNYEIQR